MVFLLEIIASLSLQRLHFGRYNLQVTESKMIIHGQRIAGRDIFMVNNGPLAVLGQRLHVHPLHLIIFGVQFKYEGAAAIARKDSRAGNYLWNKPSGYQVPEYVRAGLCWPIAYLWVLQCLKKQIKA